MATASAQPRFIVEVLACRTPFCDHKKQNTEMVRNQQQKPGTLYLYYAVYVMLDVIRFGTRIRRITRNSAVRPFTAVRSWFIAQKVLWMFVILTHVQTLAQVLIGSKRVHFVLPRQNFPFEVKFYVDKKNQLDVTFCILYFSSNTCSTCFGQPCAHHQELTTVWCYSLVLVCAVTAGRLSRPVGR